MVPMTTTRLVRDDVKNVLDYLMEAELALYANEVSLNSTRVSWHAHDPTAAFITTRKHPDIGQYLAWLAAGIYSAVLLDGSLIQITYDVQGGKIVGHRLAYIPCPYIVDPAFLEEGEAIADVVEMYRDSEDGNIALRSPVRFDFDPKAARSGHPAAHLTINSIDCRVACVAPLGVHRFIDFVFRHFYPQLRTAHLPFFEEAAKRPSGESVLLDEDRKMPHIMWDLHSMSTA
ncbi:DUF2290 domain-containing protein [Lentzea sp. E54]|uniref:DUF2290 domain-containing protein n=1 Tax=Lentzea xerophila TaxID=3435883 RepID=UPI003DA20D3B